MGADELIESGQGPGLRWPKRTAGLFLAVLVGTGAAEVLFPPLPVVLLGQERREAAAAAVNPNFWDGSLAHSIETDFKLRGRVRRLLAPYWAALTLQLGDSPDNAVIVGQDGWLFFRDRTVLGHRRKVEGREILANLYGLAHRSLRSGGIELVCAPIPRKASICAEFLPEGLDPDVWYDQTVVEALRLRGVQVIDLAPHWAKLTPEECYLRYDTHWALPARLETAKQIGRQGTNLPRKQSKFSFFYGEEKRSTGALRYAGVDYPHPVNAFFDIPVDREIVLIPHGAEEDLNTRFEESDVLLVGSSFSAAYWMQGIMCNMLQSPVEDASEKGQPPLYSLRKALVTRDDEDLPRYIISEFPIHQAVETGRGAEPVVRAALGLARHMDYAGRVEPIAEELLSAPVRSEPEVNRSLIQYPGRSLLSSGDGVLGIQVSVDSPAIAQWQINSSGASVLIATRPGEVRVRALPIIENGNDDGFYAWIKPTTEKSLNAEISSRIVTDADLGNGLRFTGDPQGDGSWRAELDEPVEPLLSLALSWDQFVTGPVDLVAEGTGADGEPVTRTWSFPGARNVRFLIVTLGPFDGGRLERVKLRGASEGVEGILAPQLRR